MRSITQLFVVIMVLVPCLTGQAQNLLNEPEGISFDAERDRYLVSNWTAQAVVAIDLQGNQSYFATGLPHCANNLIVGDTLFITCSYGLVGYRLSTDEHLFTQAIALSSTLDGITTDGNGFLYLQDHSRKIFKVNISDLSSWLYVGSGLGTYPQDIEYDADHNRLLSVSYQSSCPIVAVNLADTSVENVCDTGLNNLDGMAVDAEGNIYITSWGSGSVYRYHSDFSQDPVVISSGHNGPSGLGYNATDNVMAIANFYSDEVNYVDLDELGVTDPGQMAKPATMNLLSCYPNPFNPHIRIDYQLPLNGPVTIAIVNSRGEIAADLITDRWQTAGNYSLDFSSVNLASGIYFVHLTAPALQSHQRIVLIK